MFCTFCFSPPSTIPPCKEPTQEIILQYTAYTLTLLCMCRSNFPLAAPSTSTALRYIIRLTIVRIVRTDNNIPSVLYYRLYRFSPIISRYLSISKLFFSALLIPSFFHASLSSLISSLIVLFDALLELSRVSSGYVIQEYMAASFLKNR